MKSAKTTPRWSARSKPHEARRAQRQKREARGAREKQHGDEGHVHAEALCIGDRGLPAQARGEKAGGADHEADPAERPENDRQIVDRIGRFAAEKVVIERGDRGRGKTGEEAVKGEVMVEAAPVRRALLLRSCSRRRRRRDNEARAHRASPVRAMADRRAEALPHRDRARSGARPSTAQEARKGRRRPKSRTMAPCGITS